MWERFITHTPATASYWAAQSKYSDTTTQVASGTLGASKVDFLYSRATPAGTQEDFAQFGLHLCVNPVAAGYASLTDTQKADAETDLDALAAVIKALQPNEYTHTGYAWHDVTAGDQFYGPVDRITVRSNVGTSISGRMPDQLAANVTLRTASRKHWGRFYIPGVASDMLDFVYGRLNDATCDTLAGAVRTLGLALEANSAKTVLVVYSHKHQAVMSVDEIHCDNVVDVIRRRRAKTASYRKSYSS